MNLVRVLSQTIFSGPCHVTIMSPEGVDVFEIGEHTPEEAHYKFLGFPEPGRQVEVIDYRPAGIRALEYALRTEDVSKFADEFGCPAFVTVERIDESYRVTLQDIPAHAPQDPPRRLWLVNGLGDTLPTYDYRICASWPRRTRNISPASPSTISPTGISRAREARRSSHPKRRGTGGA